MIENMHTGMAIGREREPECQPPLPNCKRHKNG